MSRRSTPRSHMPASPDLHTHSTASDGTLTPSALVAEAAASGITTLALTDHDTTAGVAEARRAALDHGLDLVGGVEISVTWQGKLLHVVGLGIDTDEPGLHGGLRNLQDRRRERARAMDASLRRAGVHGILDAAADRAGDGMITRSHFARELARQGHCNSPQDAFKRFLKPGKPGYVKTRWAELDEALGWIRGAGGVGVLAHPFRYNLTASWLRRAVEAFREAGGTAMEVVCGNHSAAEIAAAAELAARYGLRASAGSDYHGPETPWLRLGRLPRLPAGVEPVWSDWPRC